MNVKRQPVMIRAKLVCMLVSCMSAGAQIAPVPPGAQAPVEASPHRLDWNWRRDQELTWKQSLGRTQNLSASERDRLLRAIADQLSSVEFQSEEERKKAPADARIKYVVLSGNDNPEVVVQAGDNTSCSPTGNCAFWILRRRGNSYSSMLQAEAQTFTIQPSRTNGFYDIVLTRHGSAFDSEVKVYRFDGESYKEGDCYWASWEQSSADGRVHKLRAPKLTPCGAR